jgi:hypothetical protein
MAQQLRILQSLWAMERRRADEAEWPLQTQLAMIRDAGFDGTGVRFIDPAFARKATSFLHAHGMIWQARCYPTSVDDLKPVLELVARHGSAPTTSTFSRTCGRIASRTAFRCSTDGEGWPTRPVLQCMWRPTATA